MNKFTRRGEGRLFLALFLAFFAFGFTAKAQAPYGEQYYNYGFEEWNNEGSSSVEPKHWHSFKSASGSYSFLMSQQINYSTETRPGSEGNRSARIYSKKIATVTANGNMTTGRINASSMSPSSSSNYNYTQRNSDYCTPISSLPDSVSVWVCFRANNGNSQASMMTAIHGDADFQQLGDGGYSPANMLCATANLQYNRTCASGESLVWKRLSIPFTAYPDVCTDYRYILTTFTTNKTPGGGDADDEVYVDDICLIYNPELKLGNINQTEYMMPLSGSAVNVEIPFTLSGSMSTFNLNVADNEVIAQLSDANGSFANPIELGRVTTNQSGTIQGVIPSYIEEGSAYRIRVVSTNYPMTSQDNGANIVITKEKLPLNPRIEIALSYVSTSSIEATFTPNEDCYMYYIYLSTAADMQAQIDLGQSMEEVVKTNGLGGAGNISYMWNDLSDDTEYTVYALPIDVDGEYGEVATLKVKTEKEVDAGVSYISLYAQIVSSTAVAIRATPNEYTSVYHYVVMAKADAETLTNEEIMQIIVEDENPLYEIDEWEWPIETDVVYCAIACGQNSQGEWGEISQIEFVAESRISEIEAAVTVLSANEAVATIVPNEHTAKYHFDVVTKSQYEQEEETAWVEYLLANTEENTSGGQFELTAIEKDTDYVLIAIGLNKYDETGVMKTVEFTTVGIGCEELTNVTFSIYPNPASEYVKVSSDVNIDEISVFSVDGKTVYSQSVNQQETTIDLSGFNNGIYIVRMISNGEVVVRRIVRN